MAVSGSHFWLACKLRADGAYLIRAWRGKRWECKKLEPLLVMNLIEFVCVSFFFYLIFIIWSLCSSVHLCCEDLTFCAVYCNVCPGLLLPVLPVMWQMELIWFWSVCKGRRCPTFRSTQHVWLYSSTSPSVSEVHADTSVLTEPRWVRCGNMTGHSVPQTESSRSFEQTLL